VDLNRSERTLLEYIREAREKRETMSPQAEALGVGVDGAYKIQAATREGREFIGYKLAFIGPAKQTQMDVDSPIYGRVYEDMILERPVRLSSMIQPRLEPELAVMLGEDLPPDTSPGAVHLVLGGIYLAVDFLSSIWEDYRFSAADVVADNASGGGFF
jgi:2-keto-4-pentenoate hydratase